VAAVRLPRLPRRRDIRSVSKLTFPYIFLSLLWSASQAMQAQDFLRRAPPNAVDPTGSRLDLTGILTGASDLPRARDVVGPHATNTRQIRPYTGRTATSSSAARSLQSQSRDATPHHRGGGFIARHFIKRLSARAGPADPV